MEKYLEGHSPLLAGGAGYKALLVVDGETEGYVHVTAIKVLMMYVDVWAFRLMSNREISVCRRNISRSPFIHGNVSCSARTSVVLNLMPPFRFSL